MSASSSDSDREKAQEIVSILASTFGEIPWWPGDTDEVMIGAILTQQTRWENVEQALALLKQRNLITLAAIYTTDPETLIDAIRCTGFYRVKSRRLKELATFVIETYGGISGMVSVPTDSLRIDLLKVKGIGEETADSILCFGFDRQSFVIDSYTERISRCAGITTPRPGLKSLFEQILPKDSFKYRQTHAHMVEYAKRYCTRKRCDGCKIAILNE